MLGKAIREKIEGGLVTLFGGSKEEEEKEERAKRERRKFESEFSKETAPHTHTHTQTHRPGMGTALTKSLVQPNISLAFTHYNGTSFCLSLSLSLSLTQYF